MIEKWTKKWHSLTKHGKRWFYVNGAFAIMLILGTMINVHWAKNVIVFWIAMSMLSKIIVAFYLDNENAEVVKLSYKDLDKLRPIGDNPSQLFDFIMLSALIGTGCWILFIMYLIDCAFEYHLISRLRLDKIKADVLEQKEKDLKQFKDDAEVTKNNINKVKEVLIQQRESLKPSMN